MITSVALPTRVSTAQVEGGCGRGPQGLAWLRAISLTAAVPYKVHLKSPKVVGVVTSRGNREYMEDATSVCALEIDAGELERSLPLSAADWAPENAGDHELARQVEYFGIFDG